MRRYGVEVDGLNRVLQGVGREGLKGWVSASPVENGVNGRE